MKMRKAINYILVIGSIISIALALKFSALPVIDFLPNNVIDFWVCSSEEQQQYGFIYDLAVGFLMSAMFYFIVDEIPERIKLEKGRKILSVPVKQLLWSMEVIISLIISKYGCSKDLNALTEKDFLQLNGDVESNKEEVSYSTSIYDRKTNQRKTGFRTFGTINDIIKNEISSILVTIEKIENYECFYNSDIEFIECIKNIEGCSFIKDYRKDIEKPSSCFLFAGTNNSMAEFVNLYLKLSNMNFHTEYTKTTLDTKKQTKQYHDERESGKLLQEFIDRQIKQHESAQNNPILVICGDKYTSQIICKQMKKDLEAKYINISNIGTVNWNFYRYIVIILDNETYNKFNLEFQKIEIPLDIICVAEDNSIFENYNAIKRISNINILDILTFKSTVRLGNTDTYLNKGEPSETTIREIIHKIKNIVFEE